MRSKRASIVFATTFIVLIWLSRSSSFFSCTSKLGTQYETDRVNISQNKYEYSNCKVSSEYVASSWERTWTENIALLKSDERGWSRGCGQIQEDIKYLTLFQELTNIELAETFIRRRKDELLAQVFSYHQIYDSCTKKAQFMYIEPLVSFSTSCCNLHSKRYRNFI